MSLNEAHKAVARELRVQRNSQGASMKPSRSCQRASEVEGSHKES